MHKYIICVLFLLTKMGVAQYYSDTQIQTIHSNLLANEGDMYLDTINNIQYIGTTNGMLKTIGENIFSNNGEFDTNRTITGNQHNLTISDIDTSIIDSKTIDLKGEIKLSDITQNTEVSKTLVIDDNGRIFSRPPSQAQSDIILIDPTPVTITGSGYQTIHNITIPGGTLDSNHVVRVSLFIRRTSGNSSIRLRAQYDGTTIAQMPNFNGNNPAKTELILFGAGTPNSQRAYIYHSNSGSNGLGTGGTSKDSNQDLILSIQADLNNNSHTWICDFIMVEAIR